MSTRVPYIDPSDVSSAVFDLSSTANNIAARAGGGQALATALSATYNRVTVCATAADSVRLPVALEGSRVVVFNRGAASLNVFPSTGGNIDSLAANAAFAVATTKSCEFVCMVSGTWNSMLSA